MAINVIDYLKAFEKHFQEQKANREYKALNIPFLLYGDVFVHLSVYVTQNVSYHMSKFSKLYTISNPKIISIKCMINTIVYTISILFVQISEQVKRKFLF